MLSKSDGSERSGKIVSVLDYGSGNLGSVLRALKALSRPYQVVRTPAEVLNADALIFPGVGSAEQAIANLKHTKNDESIVTFARSGKPLLGICVGMQVLCEKSEEGAVQGLGLFPFDLVKFQVSEPIPHMGWNELVWNKQHPEFLRIPKSQSETESNCYFVHSFYAKNSEKSELKFSAPKSSITTDPVTSHQEYILAETEYAGVRFPSFIANTNVWGMQFHVEKSGSAGLALLDAFCAKVYEQC